jgi:hypothetical protein
MRGYDAAAAAITVTEAMRKGAHAHILLYSNVKIINIIKKIHKFYFSQHAIYTNTIYTCMVILYAYYEK